MTPAPDAKTATLAVLCDCDGIVRQVLLDGLESGVFEIGRPFLAAISGAHHNRARAFLDTVRSTGVARDWALSLVGDETPPSIHFSGSHTPDGLFIAGAAIVPHDDVAAAPPEAYPDTSIEANNYTASAPVSSAPGAPPGRLVQDAELYNELARLNNELVTTQRELIQRNIELERLNEVKNQFIGIAAHDLRSPLQVIQGYSQMLLERMFGELSDEQEQFITVIRRNSDFMFKLITDLLYITKIDAGKLQLEKQPADIVAVVENNLGVNRLLAESKEIEIRLAPSAKLPPIAIDVPKIEQVLNNLIGNAIKFSHPNTAIDVEVAGRDDEVTISIRDQGQGIPAEEIGLLFKPFENLSVKSTWGEPSTGLGLAIVKRIVEGHGGKIWVESEVGAGSTFTFALPYE